MAVRGATRRGRGRLLALLLVVGAPVAALGFVVGSAGPAAAHTTIVSSDPQQGEVLSTPPSTIRITFAQAVLPVGSALEVLGPNSQEVASGRVQVSGANLTQPLKVGLPDGGYTVLWRVVAADGHPITGAFTFTVGADPAAGAVPRTSGPSTATIFLIWGAVALVLVILALFVRFVILADG
jgi:methionine-rich copper-binding protein CopC